MSAPRAGRLSDTHEPCRLSTATGTPHQGFAVALEIPVRVSGGRIWNGICIAFFV